MSRSKKHAKTVHIDSWLAIVVDRVMTERGYDSTQDFLEDCVLSFVSKDSPNASKLLALKQEHRNVTKELVGERTRTGRPLSVKEDK